MKYKLVDLETTGLDPDKDKVVEIAMVDVHTNTMSIGGTYDTLVNPEVPIPPITSAIHHLVDEDVQKAPVIENVDWSFFDDGEDCIFVAHNSNFDSGFLTKYLPEGKYWLCTQRLAEHLWPGLESYSNQFLRYHLGLNPLVREMAADDPDNMIPHRALFDTIVTALILMKELKEFNNRNYNCTPQELSRKPIIQQKAKFGKYKGQLWTAVPTSYLNWASGPDKDFDSDTKYTIKHELYRRNNIK